MRKIFLIVIPFLILVMGVGCRSVPTGSDRPSALEKKFGAFSVIKEDEDLAVIVDTELARRRKNENYFPLGVKIANKSLESLIIDRESLILVDENENIYYMPDIVELQEKYDKLAPDHKFKSQTGLIGDQILTSFTYFRQAESNFFPQTQGAARIIDSVYIRNKGYMEDLIYFPMPPGGIEGKKLKLRIDVFELEAPFEIHFTVK